MEALGLIETKGLIAAVESADAMLKAAEVTLIEKTYVGGGLVSIVVSGGVAAVKAAVEAGAAAVKQIDSSLLVSQHVIPRPSDELDCLIGSVRLPEIVEIPCIESVNAEPEKEIAVEKITAKETAIIEKIIKKPAIEKKDNVLLNLKLDEIKKEIVDKIVLDSGIEKALEILGKLKVTKLRNLAREYKKLGISGRQISKADKKKLLVEFKEYYKKN